MADDLKKITNLVETVVKKVDKLDKQQASMNAQLGTLSDKQASMSAQQASMSKKLDHIEDRQDGHTAALMSIEATLKGYADMYKVNKEKNEELETRVDNIEDKLRISKNN